MPDDVRYQHDFRGVPQLAKGAEMHMMLIDACFDAKDYAISISPDAKPHGAGYIGSFEVDGGHYETVAGVKRATCYLRNNAEHAWIVERGTETSGPTPHTPAPFRSGHHVLARTVDWLERT